MEEDVHEALVEHAILTLAGGCWVRIHAGQLSIEAVGFERQKSNDRLAWVVTDSEGSRILLDIGSIYAVEEVDMANLS